MVEGYDYRTLTVSDDMSNDESDTVCGEFNDPVRNIAVLFVAIGRAAVPRSHPPVPQRAQPTARFSPPTRPWPVESADYVYYSMDCSFDSDDSRGEDADTGSLDDID
jgi:hypothetical protein